MKYLLDTHTLLWAFSDFESLPKKVQIILQNPYNRIFVSAVSVWEISIKTSLGKLSVPNNIRDLIHQYHFRELDIDFFHAQEVEALPFFHNDPFDRLLIAQSIVENMPILTKDQYMAQYDIEVIWN